MLLRPDSLLMKWILFACGTGLVGAAIAISIGQARESSKANQLVEKLSEPPNRTKKDHVDFASFGDLPAPVARYFRHVLTDGQALIRKAEFQQSGVLRTTTSTGKWSQFTAAQTVVPPATGFLWNARINMPLGTHVRVLDSYIDGIGSGRVSLLSAITFASDEGAAELNSGALHRYLAEGVWFPTALLPQSGVAWSPIDERSALATLTDLGTSVSLEFYFNELGEVTGIYSAGRFGQFDGQYKKVPWQGYFRNYRDQAGMRVPWYGEVGWYDDGALQIVWKGDIKNARYEFYSKVADSH